MQSRGLTGAITAERVVDSRARGTSPCKLGLIILACMLDWFHVSIMISNPGLERPNAKLLPDMNARMAIKVCFVGNACWLLGSV